jgi:ABC-type dipeptide/oligopeptide/nickel transport system permease component
MLVVALSYVTINLATDLLYGLLNPQVSSAP